MIWGGFAVTLGAAGGFIGASTMDDIRQIWALVGMGWGLWAVGSYGLFVGGEGTLWGNAWVLRHPKIFGNVVGATIPDKGDPGAVGSGTTQVPQ